MISTKAKIFNFILRNRHLLTGHMQKEVFDVNTSIQLFRDKCEKGANRFGKIQDGIRIIPEIIEGMKTEWIVPQGSTDEKLIFYIHGGGYVSGSCNDHRSIVSKFAALAGYKTLTYEYRLAPEFPFPAAIDDSVIVYNKVLKSGYLPQNIVFAGESAGGGLCLALLLALKEQNLELPKAAVAISPWTDLTCSGESYKTKNKRSLAPLNSWFVFSNHYKGNFPAEYPLISPLFGDLAGLPPIFINSGSDDELFDDGRQFYEKAKAAGVEVTFREGMEMVHCYPLLAPFFPEATQAMNEIVEFVKTNLG